MKQISNKHPNIKITVSNYNRVLDLLKSKKNKTNPYSQPIRCLMAGLFNEDIYWIHSNTDKLFKQFPEIFDAINGTF
jgi:hypothetical protein